MRDTLEPLSLPKPTGPVAKVKSRFLKMENDYRKFAFRQHNEIRVAKKVLPDEIFNSYFKFAFVRNPWDRLVSEYEFIRRRPNHGRHSKVIRMEFDEYIVYQSKRRDAHQIDMLADKQGNLLMDFVGKFENLEKDWLYVAKKLGIENKELGHRKKSGIKDYKAYYTQENWDLVADLWHRDIDAFGYGDMKYRKN